MEFKLSGKLPGKRGGIDFPFEKPYLLTPASPQDDARSEANSLKLGKYSIPYSIIVYSSYSI